MCVVILIIFCWHMMLGWWAPKWQHIHVWHRWDLIAVLSLCRKQESLYVRKQTCFLGTVICRHFEKQLLKSLFSKFPHAKENFYSLNNYYYLMWLWILNSPFPKKYLHLIAILSPIIILQGNCTKCAWRNLEALLVDGIMSTRKGGIFRCFTNGRDKSAVIWYQA